MTEQSQVIDKLHGINMYPCLYRDVLDTYLYHEVCQLLVIALSFSPDTPVSSAIKNHKC
jgi:hypothetical protein